MMVVKNLQEEEVYEDEETDDEEKVTHLCSVDGKCFIGLLFSL